jgi:hypothetical protein
MHHHRFNAHFVTGTVNTQGDFAAVGNQNFFKHDVSPLHWWGRTPVSKTFIFGVTVACLRKKSRKKHIQKASTGGKANSASLRIKDYQGSRWKKTGHRHGPGQRCGDQSGELSFAYAADAKT